MRDQIYQLLKQINDEMDQKLIHGDLHSYIEKILEKSKILSVAHNHQLQGFISYYDNDEKKEVAFLSMIAITKEHRHLGYGKGLMEFSISNLKAIGFKKYKLQVLKNNFKAIALYKRFGFIIQEEKEQHCFMEMNL